MTEKPLAAAQGFRIGFVALARPTFDMALASEVAQTAQASLVNANSEHAPGERSAFNVELMAPDRLVSDLNDADAAASELAAAALDVLIVFQATFADSTLVVRLAERVHAPILLWAVPETRTGGRLRLNSLCGVNLAGHALTLRGKTYEWVYAAPDDAGALAHIQAVARAGHVYRRLRDARLGIIGQPPSGFDSCQLDEAQLSAVLGVQVRQFELERAFADTRAMNGAVVTRTRERLAEHMDNLAALDPKPLEGTLSVYGALRKLAADEGCDALAIRCWPEFFTELGCAACGAMSLLNSDQIPCGCEADANGALTQLILQWLSGEPAFGADLVEFNVQENSAVLWHCGQAPLTMADPAQKMHGGVHSNRKVPLVMEFALKPGRVTLARLSRATGELRLVIGGGEMLSAPPSFSGTSGVVRFDSRLDRGLAPPPAGSGVLATILNEGLEHHLALTYGDHRASLRALAKMLGLPTLELG